VRAAFLFEKLKRAVTFFGFSTTELDQVLFNAAVTVNTKL